MRRRQKFHHNRHRTVVRYPWDDWLTNKETRLEKGVHFSCAIHGMATMIRNMASKRRISVSLRVRDDKYITIQVKGSVE